MRIKPVDQSKIAARCLINIRNGVGESRRELADALDMSPSTAGLYVDQLIDAGYVIETGLKHGVMGRPKRRLEVRLEAGWFVGVEWNSNQASAVRLDFAGGRLEHVNRVLKAGVTSSEVLVVIEEMIAGLVDGKSGRFLGIGLGAPGVVNVDQGIAGDFPFIANWNDVPLKSHMEARFQVPVTVGNNLRVIALAERWFGGAKGLENFIILGPRSGLGVGLVIGGQVLDGLNHAAGELGNWGWVSSSGGNELHYALSAPAVWRRLTGAEIGASLPEDMRGEMANIAAKLDDCWRDVAQDFGQVVGCLHLLLDTEAIFVHGPLCGLGRGFWEAVVDYSIKLMPRLASRPPPLVCSALMDEAGALGAASLAMESWIPLL
jgi:predicted NBD/HSP70 family sugar kinase